MDTQDSQIQPKAKRTLDFDCDPVERARRWVRFIEEELQAAIDAGDERKFLISQRFLSTRRRILCLNIKMEEAAG